MERSEESVGRHLIVGGRATRAARPARSGARGSVSSRAIDRAKLAFVAYEQRAQARMRLREWVRARRLAADPTGG